MYLHINLRLMLESLYIFYLGLGHRIYSLHRQKVYAWKLAE